jgi:hypothetical protein
MMNPRFVSSGGEIGHYRKSIRTITVGTRLIFFGGDMDTRQKTPVEPGKGNREEVRTKDNPIGIDDIGLQSGIRKDEVGRLEEIRPDPGKTSDKS